MATKTLAITGQTPVFYVNPTGKPGDGFYTFHRPAFETCQASKEGRCYASTVGHEVRAAHRRTHLIDVWVNPDQFWLGGQYVTVGPAPGGGVKVY